MKRNRETSNKKAAFVWLNAALVSITPHCIQVIGKRPRGGRIVFEFSPYQGIKITSIDCFPGFPGTIAGKVGHVCEVRDSKWLSALRRALEATDHSADFLDHSKHFVLSTEGAVVEIVAWSWKIKRSPMTLR